MSEDHSGARREHDCPRYIAPDPAAPGYGVAIDSDMTSDADGVWWIGNGEYASAIRYCPWCGVELATLDDPAPERAG